MSSSEKNVGGRDCLHEKQTTMLKFLDGLPRLENLLQIIISIFAKKGVS